MTVLEFPDEAGPGLAACLDVYRRLTAGVSVVTALGDDGPCGMTASSVTSVSLRPPLLLVSLAESSRTLAAIRSRRAFGVHLLRDGALDARGERVHQRRVVRRTELAPRLQQRLDFLSRDRRILMHGQCLRGTGPCSRRCRWNGPARCPACR